MKKQYKILAIISFLLLMLFMGFPNNLIPPERYFSNNNTPEKIYLEFKKGGDTMFSSKLPNNRLVIVDSESITHFYKRLQNLEFDLWAPHRPSDYTVYMKIENKTFKLPVQMSRIDGDYVFLYKKGKYRNPRLAQLIIELLEIER